MKRWAAPLILLVAFALYALAGNGIKGYVSYGSLWITTPAANAVTANSEELVAGTSTAGALSGFTHNGSNRLTRVGDQRLYEITLTCSFEKTAGGVATRVTMYMAVNGVVVATKCEVDRSLGAGLNDHGSVSVACQTTLGDTEFVEPWIEADQNVTLLMDHLQLNVREIE